MRRLTWLYLLAAACVPMFALTLLVLIGTGNRLALLLLSLGGLAGFALVFWLARLIQGDLDALASLASGGIGTGDGFASTWASRSSRQASKARAHATGRD